MKFNSGFKGLIDIHSNVREEMNAFSLLALGLCKKHTTTNQFQHRGEKLLFNSLISQMTVTL